jgi:adenine-specific DNA-methyltransferase
MDSTFLDGVTDYILLYAKSREHLKYRQLFRVLERGEEGATRYNYALLPDGTTLSLGKTGASDSVPTGTRFFTDQGLTSRTGTASERFSVGFQGNQFLPNVGSWRTNPEGFARVKAADRVMRAGQSIRFKKFFDDFGALAITNLWNDVGGGIASRVDPKVYVVQTSTTIIERCLLMATDPGDLVIDPTCGSGTTAYVAEQWGRRWITIDTSRVALALARARIMGARYPYYLLADSREGQKKEADLTAAVPSTQAVHGNVRLGFVYERVPHITLKSIANNAEIEVIHDKWQPKMEPLRETLNKALKKKWEEWEIPRDADAAWSAEIKKLHGQWWEARISRQKEIDASIAAKAESE